MKKHIYAFGSVCRGEVLHDSDVDMLVILDEESARLSREHFSIYSYAKIVDLWLEGNPFSWHLFLESKLVFASDGRDHIRSLGAPTCYSRYATDYAKFARVFEDSAAELSGAGTAVFELSMLFLAVRNIAICYALASGRPVFGRDAALRIGSDSLRIDSDVYGALESARMLSTRGLGEPPSPQMIQRTVSAVPAIRGWISGLSKTETL